MKIQVVGKGCRNCKKLLENTKQAVQVLDLDAQIEYVTEMDQIIELGVIKTPALLVDGKSVSTGKVLKEDEIVELLK